MNFSRITLPASQLRSLVWEGDSLVDWVEGARYSLDGSSEQMNIGASYRFDAAVGLGRYGVTFETLGTKGLLLRDNGRREERGYVPMSVDVLREIDRSYYQADAYSYPVAMFLALGERPVLAHCPRGYNILDFEDLDGTCLTPRPCDGAADVFHSRLEASADGRWFLSNGWIWHPSRVICLYDVERALDEPTYISGKGENVNLGDSWEWEVTGATFVDHRVICLADDETNELAIFDLESMRHERTFKLADSPGTRLMALGDDHVVLFDGNPRVLNLSTGRIVERWDDLDGGDGLHQPSVVMKPPAPPWLARDPVRKRFALGTSDTIVVVSFFD